MNAPRAACTCGHIDRMHVAGTGGCIATRCSCTAFELTDQDASGGLEPCAQPQVATAGQGTGASDRPSSPTHRAGHVVAECPLCGWRSAESPIGEGPNAEWFARNPAAAEYRKHFDVAHRPLARFLRSVP